MTNYIKRLAATVVVLAALVASVQQRIERKDSISGDEQAVTKAAEPRTREVLRVYQPQAELAHPAAEESSQSSGSIAPGIAIFSAFEGWFERYESADAEAGELEVEGEKIAIERKAALAELIPTHPELALKMAVPYERRKILPESIARHLEEPVSGMARYDVIAFAPGTRPPGSSSVERYATLNNRTYTASVYGRRVAVPSKTSIPLHGIAIGGALAIAEHPVRILSALEAEDRAASAPQSAAFCPISTEPGSVKNAAEVGGEVRYFCQGGHIAALNAELEEAENGVYPPIASFNGFLTHGNKSLLLIRVNFPDDLSERLSVGQANRMIEEVNSFFIENSYGALSIRGTVTPLLTLPLPKDAYRLANNEAESFVRVLTAARAAALAAGFNSSNYDLDCVHLDGSVVSARGYVSGKGFTLQDDGAGTACHELGHNLGLWHANAWRSSDNSITGTGVNSEYGNCFDTMGSGSRNFAPFNPYHRFRLGWLPESAVQTISSDGIYTLYPFNIPELEAGRAYALKLRKDDARDYWIETRGMENGQLLINWSPWHLSSGGTQLLDMTPASKDGFYDAGLKFGASFYDSELGIKIVPLRPSASAPGAVDVLVQHVHYLAFGVQDAKLSNGYTITEEPDAGSGKAVKLDPTGSALFTVNVAAAGDYTLWCRTLGSWAPIVISVDEQAGYVGSSLETASTTEWQWSRVLSSGVPVSLSLSPGPHTVRLSGGTSLTKIDSILLMDDPTADFPPVFQPIPDQVATIGEQMIVSGYVVVPEGSSGTNKVTARTSNENVVRPTDIWTEQRGFGGEFAIVITPQKPGETVISLRTTSADGRSGTTSFTLSIRGLVQRAIDAAAPGDTVFLPAGTYIDHVTIDKDISLQGAGAGETIIDGNKDGTTIVIASDAVVTLKSLSIRRGTGGLLNWGTAHLADCEIAENVNSPRSEGGIWNGSGAEMSIERSTISSNRCNGRGAGIYNLGTLRLSNSTVSANRTTLKDGGGINNSGQVYATHCTVAFNRAKGGGGIANTGTIEMSNTIVAGNTADAESSSDLKGLVLSQGFNLIQTTSGADIQGDLNTDIVGRDPLLAPLMGNGGSNRTHALLPGSPAIDAGNSAGLETDQRGLRRVLDARSIPNVGDGCDIGAYEFVPDESDLAPLPDSGVNPTIALRRDHEGDIVIAVDGGTGFAWLLEATSDFVSWERIGLVGPGQTAGLKDPASRDASHRFYRVTRY